MSPGGDDGCWKPSPKPGLQALVSLEKRAGVSSLYHVKVIDNSQGKTGPHYHVFTSAGHESRRG